MIKDSGKREEFNSGAVRDVREGKGRFDLISPFALMRLAKWYEEGAKKYCDRNWEKGMPFSRYLDSAFRHLTKFLMGMEDEDHLAAATWNIFAIMHHQEREETYLDDLPHYNSKIPCICDVEKEEPKRIYIAGKMSGRNMAEVIKERFIAMSMLLANGFIAIDPQADHFATKNFNVATLNINETTGDDMQGILNLTDAEIVEQDKKLMSQCNAVLVLTGDDISSGTWLEFGYAKYFLNIPVVVIAQNPTTWTRNEASAVVKDIKEAINWFKDNL